MRLAGITGQGKGATDRLLAAVADRLTQDGIRLLGTLRPTAADAGSGQCNSDLLLLPDGPLMRITQDLGSGSGACRMDAGAFEEAVGMVVARVRADQADLVILNKFGLSEAEGRGFRAVIAEALGRDVPVLTGLSDTHRAAFERFAEGTETILQPKEDAILAWCRSVVANDTTLRGDA
ncbi:DUF2478 domain-containing protein [Nioella ostreopsis]|jgi:nucleoside-triphosphatase THEP1|uniref:DUF2478 domain-containing protein n=1 Tax=Nioella ostreopsis TaxID=2448479 RepID=UPI000FD8F8C5|nr:DUF2478 domain-containing protein [Nioella ostreopsis]